MSNSVYSDILKNTSLKYFLGVTVACVAPLLIHTLFFTPKRVSYRAIKRDQKEREGGETQKRQQLFAVNVDDDVHAEADEMSGGGCPFLGGSLNDSSPSLLALPSSPSLQLQAKSEQSLKSLMKHNPREVLAKYKKEHPRVIGLCKFF